jgi:hypothetical protein
MAVREFLDATGVRLWHGTPVARVDDDDHPPLGCVREFAPNTVEVALHGRVGVVTHVAPGLLRAVKLHG